ncbi:MAG: hypothetical protein ACNS60_06600 [Candidatus Cyclobacteriaceae bacterium M2_1C_046]
MKNTTLSLIEDSLELSKAYEALIDMKEGFICVRVALVVIDYILEYFRI